MSAITRPSFRSGVTIFEILIVVAILSILALTGMFTTSHLAKARDAKRKAQIDRIRIAAYDYYTDQGCFPTKLPSCDQSLAIRGQSYAAIPCDPLDQPYIYQTDGLDCPKWFKVLTTLEYKKDPAIDEIGCTWGCGPLCAYNYGVSSSNIKVNMGCVSYYGCSPSGYCLQYDDPIGSRCPITFENDPTCRNINCADNKESTKSLRCHDNRGKQVNPTNTPKPTATPKK